MDIKINPNVCLYRKNNKGEPTFWTCYPYDSKSIMIAHGIVGKTILTSIVNTNRDAHEEVKSRRNAKRKIGYKLLRELKDNNEVPVKDGDLLPFLNTYLPTERTTGDGNLLPMLAKVYTPKVFTKCDCYYGQWKINGLRCFIRAKISDDDMFHRTRLVFQSREGTIWNSLGSLEDYLLDVLPSGLVNDMVRFGYALDGELYLPGHTVNEINHFVKDANCKENKLIQYWCYDAAIEDAIQEERIKYLHDSFDGKYSNFSNKDDHLNNTSKFILLPNRVIANDTQAITTRDFNIRLGFEGLILRKPDAEYQYGKRNQSMIKFKATTDGKFEIVDIYSEGIKRNDVPLLKCKNDINPHCFEVHLSAPLGFQKTVLRDKECYIGRKVLVTYGERSGVNLLPFHVKEVKLI